MNIKNVRKLLSHLKRQQKSREAARFNMNYFGMKIISNLVEDMLEAPVCHTQACLAGEAVLSLKAGYIQRGGGIEIYRKSSLRDLDIEDAATKLLGLSAKEKNNLFFFPNMLSNEGNGGWPSKFVEEYKDAQTPADRLAVAIRRVEHFIETKGKE